MLFTAETAGHFGAQVVKEIKMVKTDFLSCSQQSYTFAMLSVPGLPTLTPHVFITWTEARLGFNVMPNRELLDVIYQYTGITKQKLELIGR